MLTNVATVLAGLIGAGIIFIGARAFWTPQAAAGFGIPGTPTEDRIFQSWLTVKAVRDIASGLFVFILLAGGSPHLLGWFMLVATRHTRWRRVDRVAQQRTQGSRLRHPRQHRRGDAGNQRTPPHPVTAPHAASTPYRVH